MRKLAIAGNLAFILIIAFVVFALNSGPSDYGDPYYVPSHAEIRQQASVGRHMILFGLLAAAPSALSLYALVSWRLNAMALAYYLSIAGTAIGGLMSVIGFLIWLPPYLAHHFTDDGGAAGGIMMFFGLPVAMFCGANFLALRAMRRGES